MARVFSMMGCRIQCTSIVTLAIVIAPPALGESVRELILRGNEQYREGAIDQAVDLYQEAIEADPEALEAIFNQAVSKYEQGELEEAERLLRRVDSSPGAGSLAQAARYNLGRLRLDQTMGELASGAQQGQGAPIAELERAVAGLEDAARFFRGALDLDPTDQSAAKNLELTRYSLRDMQDQIDKMKELQERLQELAEELQENQTQQQEEARQTQQTAEQQQREREEQGAESEQTQAQNQEQSRDQESLSERTQDIAERLDELRQEAPISPSQQGEGDPLERASESLERAREQQREAEDAFNQGQTQQAQQKQEEAAQSLRDALDAIEQQQQEQQQQGQGEQKHQQEQDQQEQPQDDPGDQSQESESQEPQESNQNQAPEDQSSAQPEARDELVEAILDKERRDRERAQRLEARRRALQPVEKDW